MLHESLPKVKKKKEKEKKTTYAIMFVSKNVLILHGVNYFVRRF